MGLEYTGKACWLCGRYLVVSTESVLRAMEKLRVDT